MLIKRISTILLLSMIFGSFFPPIRVSANTGFHIRPPFVGDFKLTSYFDHTSPTGVRDYDYITIYTGDTSEDGDPYYYSAHGGLDWGMDINTPIYAVADGNVRFIGDEGAIGFGKYIQIDHNNGYFSIYAHLSSVYISINHHVSAGEVIGYSGNTGNSSGPHLHLGIYYGSSMSPAFSTDPFGWMGTESDPLIGFEGVGQQANCLWRSEPQDPISCNDIVVEDGSWDFLSDSSWYVNGLLGYGDHSLTHLNTSNQNDSKIAYWFPRYLRTGSYLVYVYVPPMSDGQQHSPTSSAKYTIHSNYDISTDIIVNQGNCADQWVYLGSFYMWNYSYIELTTFTNETSTTIVGADAIKFRTYPIFVPNIAK